MPRFDGAGQPARMPDRRFARLSEAFNKLDSRFEHHPA